MTIDPKIIEKANRARMEKLRGASIPDHVYTALRSQVEVEALAAALAAVADDLRAEGAAEALREAADDMERRINEPNLILAADQYGGFHAGERARGQREVDVLRTRADAIEAGQS